MKYKALAGAAVAVCLLAPSAALANQITNTASYPMMLPSVASFGDEVYVFFGVSPRRLQYTTTADGATWSSPTATPTSSSAEEPVSAVEYRGKLHLFYADSSTALRYRTLDAFGIWSGEMTVPGASTDDATGLAVFNDRLYVVWETAGSSDRMRYASMDGNGQWSGVQVVPFGLTRRAPTAAVFNNRLYIAYSGVYGSYSQQIWYGYMDATGNWFGEWKPSGDPRTGIDELPALATLGNQLHLIYGGGTTDDLLLKRMDPFHNWSAEQVIDSKIGPGVDAAVFASRIWVVWYQYDAWFTNVDYVHYLLYP